MNALRVARLKGDVYLLQAKLEDEDGFYLVPFRVSRAREVTPLACDFGQAAAKQFNVRLQSGPVFGLELLGERAGIIGLLASASTNGSSQSQVDTFIPAARELAGHAASAPGFTAGGCSPCPAGGCIQGTVTDQTGQPMPGATVRAHGVGVGVPVVVRTGEQGQFLLTGLGDGKVELRVELPGFSALKIGPLQVKTGITHLFDKPFEVAVLSPPFETVAAPQEPRLCGGAAKSRAR